MARSDKHHSVEHNKGRNEAGSPTHGELYLLQQGVTKRDFNSYGSRRGNPEVMMRGTFANVGLRNRLAPGTEGGVTVHVPGGDPMSIFDASVRYRAEGVPLLILAGQ